MGREILTNVRSAWQEQYALRLQTMTVRRQKRRPICLAARERVKDYVVGRRMGSHWAFSCSPQLLCVIEPSVTRGKPLETTLT